MTKIGSDTNRPKRLNASTAEPSGAQIAAGTPSHGVEPSSVDPRLGLLLRLVCRDRHVSLESMLMPSRGRAEIASARQLAMYLAHVVLSQPVTVVAGAFGRHWSTVGYACAAIEDQRDDPDFDEAVSRLEAMLVAANENDPPRAVTGGCDAA